MISFLKAMSSHQASLMPDPEIRDGDEVLVVGRRALATGRAAMSAQEMIKSHRGVAVRVRKIKKV